MDEIKAERLVQAVEKIAACLEVISKHLEGSNKRKPVCKHPQKKKDLLDNMSDEEILKAVENLPDPADSPNPYPDPTK